MKATDQVDLNYIEQPDALEFSITRKRGWLSTALGLIIALLAVCLFWRTGRVPVQIMAILAGAGCAISFVANWIHGSQTRLRVTSGGLVVRGNLNSWFRNELSIDSNELTSLEWQSGGEGGDSGLYARWGWQFRCLIADITPQQAAIIRDAIAKKFPELQLGDSSPGSFLFGDESGLTSLGLSDPDSDSSKIQD